MKKDLFEEYLKSVHAENYIGTDDDMPDSYEHWLSNLDVDDWMLLAENYGKILALRLGEQVLKLTDPKPEYSGITWEHIISKISF